MKQNILSFTAGILIGSTLLGNTIASGIIAEPGRHRIFVDGKEVQMEAYNINANNYMKLRDIGKAVGFNVYWDSVNSCVQIESGKPYTGEAPQQTTVTPASPTEMTVDDIRQEMIERINAMRRENGVGELVVNEALMQAAQMCAEQMLPHHDMSIECTTALSCGYPYGFESNLTIFAGPIAEKAAEVAVGNWENSPGHKRAMLASDADTIGVGVKVIGRTYHCFMFAGCPKTHNPYE